MGTKPWEETWRWDAGRCEVHRVDERGRADTCDPIVETDGGIYGPHGADGPFIAAAPEMARLLLELEWVSQEGDEGSLAPQCQVCEVYPQFYWHPKWDEDESKRELRHRNDHKPDCALLAVLKKAGVRE